MDEETLFHHALQRPAAERDAYLEEACGGDTGLRLRVRALVHAADNPGDFMGRPAASLVTATGPRAPGDGDAASAPTVIPEGPGTRVGPYKLLQQIGEGGMGVVFMAEQAHPVRRKVAVKIIKPGMDSRQVIARFEAERQALAMMDHPNIAKVLEAGTTESGRLYFVMELVSGVPITRYCDELCLPVVQRLGLFVHVCHAIQHAHQKGVIHRDLKPGNVLVALYDTEAVPKVIDFGVAKATGQQLTEATLFTGFGSVVGTVEYMSPEQAGLNQLDVDTRSDVYSLGVLLYELLTGSTPLQPGRVKGSALLDVLRLVREEEAPTPSTRLASGEHAPSVATCRGLEPKKLSVLVRGELDWIVMRCLEKDRTRRYETASALAADVQRYLADEPVQACPPSPGYQLRKFVRRHKGPVLAAAVVVLALVGGVVGTGWQAVRANEARALALGERNAKQAALEAERSARRQALAALETLTDEAVKRLIGRQEKLTAADRAFLKKILAHYLILAACMKGDTVESRAVRAEGYARVGLLQSSLGENREARASYEEAIRLFQRLAAEVPAEPGYRGSLVANRCNLGLLLEDVERHAEAGVEYREAIRLGVPLAADFPAVPKYRQDLANTRNNFGGMLAKLGKHPEAEAEYKQSFGIYRRLVAEYPDVPDYRKALIVSHCTVASVLEASGKLTEAEAEYRQAIMLGKQPGDSEKQYEAETATTYYRMAKLLKRAGRPKEAEDAFRGALAIRKDLAAAFPVIPRYRAVLGHTHHELATLLDGSGRAADAEAEYLRAIRIEQQLADDFPALPVHRVNLLASRSELAKLLTRLGRPAEATAEFRYAAALAEQLVYDCPAESAYYRRHVGFIHSSRALLLADFGERGEAEAGYRQAIAAQERQVAAAPDPADSVALAGSYCNLGNLLRDSGSPDQAVEWHDRAIQTLMSVAGREPDPVTARTFLRNSHWGRALTYELLGRHANAVGDWDRAVELTGGRAALPLRLKRANSIVRTGDHARAFAEAAALASATDVSAATLYHAACVCGSAAAAAKGDVGLHDRYANGAMELLADAESRGYFAGRSAVDQLKRDASLNELRKRSDFLALLTRLDENVAKSAAEGWRSLEAEVAASSAALDRAGKHDSAAAPLLMKRGRAYARLGRFGDAEADFSRLMSLSPGDFRGGFYRACLLAYSGLEQEHRDHCKSVSERFGAGSDALAARFIARSYLLVPGAVDLAAPLAMVERALEQPGQTQSKRLWDNLTKALALYRCGRYEECLAWADRCRSSDQKDVSQIATADLIRAMANHKLGRHEQAKAALQGAAKRMESMPQAGCADLDEPGWSVEHWLVAQTLRREADRLLGVSSSE